MSGFNKTLILLGFCCFCSFWGFAAASPVTVTGTVRDRFGALRSTTVAFKSLDDVTMDNPFVEVPVVLSTNSAANGTFTVNLLPGNYQVIAANTRPFFVFIPTNAVGPYNISELTTNAYVNIYSTNASGFVLWSSGTASNLTVQGSLKMPTNATLNWVWTCTNATTGAGTWVAAPGASSGVAVAAGDNVTVVTNSPGLVTVSSSGGVGANSIITNLSIAGYVHITNNAIDGIPLFVQAVSGQDGDILGIYDAATNELMVMNYDGSVRFSQSVSFLSGIASNMTINGDLTVLGKLDPPSVVISPTNEIAVALAINAGSSTTNLLEVKSAAGAKLAYVRTDGDIVSAGSLYGTGLRITNASGVVLADFDDLDTTYSFGESANQASSANGSNTYSIIGGYQAGKIATNLNSSVVLGRIAGEGASDSLSSIMIGFGAGRYATNHDYGTLLGYYAGQYAKDAIYNAGIGYRALERATNATYTVAVGHTAAQYLQNPAYVVALGFGAVGGENISTSCTNVFGAGYYALTDADELNDVIAIGNLAGRTLSNSSDVILIGNRATANKAITNAIGIGRGVTLTANDTMVLGTNLSVGIGTNAPQAALHVVGSIVLDGGTNYGDGSGLSNVTAASASSWFPTNTLLLSYGAAETANWPNALKLTASTGIVLSTNAGNLLVETVAAGTDATNDLNTVLRAYIDTKDANTTNTVTAATNALSGLLVTYAQQRTNHASIVRTNLNNEFSASNTFNGPVVHFGRFGLKSTSINLMAEDTTLIVSYGKVRVAGSGGAVISTAKPTLGTNVIDDGTVVIIQGTSDSATLTLQDQTVLAGTRLDLSEANITLGNGDSVTLEFDSASLMWRLVSRSDPLLPSDIGDSVQAYDAQLVEWSGTATNGWATLANATNAALGASLNATNGLNGLLMGYADGKDANTTNLVTAATNTLNGLLMTYAENRTNSTKIARTDFANAFSGSNYMSDVLVTSMTGWVTNKLASTNVFELGKELTHYAEGTIGFTSCSGTVPSQLRVGSLLLVCDGTSRTISVPAWVFTTDGLRTWTLTNAQRARLTMEAWGTEYTNAHYTPLF